MKHIKVFEEFTHTKSEGNELLSKYAKALTDKAAIINVSTKTITSEGEVLELKPSVKVFGDSSKLEVNEERSINIVLNVENRNRDTIGFDLYYTDENTRTFTVYKPHGYSLDDDAVYKIVQIFKDASPYVGGLAESQISAIEQTLSRELVPSGEPKSGYVRVVVKV
jgi:hypothetical protein